MIIDRLKRLFPTDSFVPTLSIFPDIDEKDIEKTLKIKDKAREHAQKDLPRSDETSLDSVELEIVARVEDLRRRGLQNYETNKDVYAKRLSRASTASMEVRSVAAAAPGDFEAETKAVRGYMTGQVKALLDWNRALLNFQAKHRLDKPAKEDSNWAVAGIILLLCFLVESVFNSGLFAARSELGLLGGAITAGLVSALNVSASVLGGLSTRLIRHVNWIIKLGGLLFVSIWLVFLIVFNLAVVHFRDALEETTSWRDASTAALVNFRTHPLILENMESWILMPVGLITAVFAFVKFVNFGEPYLGYATCSRRFQEALDAYANSLNSGLIDLQRKRDEAVKSLREANLFVRENIGEAIDALYGHRMMRSHLVAFLAQCDIKVQYLLKLYRDENRANRSSEPPKHFDDLYRFEPFSDAEIDMGSRQSAEKDLVDIGQFVDDAVQAIQQNYRVLKERYPDPDTLIGVDLGTGTSSLAVQAALPTIAETTRSQAHDPSGTLRAISGDRPSLLDAARSA